MGYDARRDELLRELANLPIPSELSGDQLALQRLETVEKPAFTRAIESWGNERRQLFEDLVKLVEDPSVAKIQEQAWSERVQRCIDAYSSSLGAVLQNVGTPTLMATRFSILTSRSERESLTLLQAARAVGACRDAIVFYRVRVVERSSALEKVWNELKSTHADFDRQEQALYAEISKMLDEAADKCARAHASREEKIKSRLAAGAQIAWQLFAPGGLDPDGWKTAVEIHLEMQHLLSGRTKQFRDLFEREISTTTVVFANRRRETEEFVSKHSYEPHLTNKLNEAKTALATLVSSSPTDGHKRDAEELSRVVTSFLDKQADEVKKIWDNFVVAHKHRFFGAVAPDKVEDLLHANAWRERSRTMTDKPKNLAQLLQRIQDESRNRFSIDVGNFDADHREQVKQMIDKEMSAAIAAMQQFRQDLERFVSERLDKDAREQALDRLMRM